MVLRMGVKTLFAEIRTRVMISVMIRRVILLMRTCLGRFLDGRRGLESSERYKGISGGTCQAARWGVGFRGRN